MSLCNDNRISTAINQVNSMQGDEDVTSQTHCRSCNVHDISLSHCLLQIPPVSLDKEAPLALSPITVPHEFMLHSLVDLLQFSFVPLTYWAANCATSDERARPAAEEPNIGKPLPSKSGKALSGIGAALLGADLLLLNE